jgi:hypothetical protein
VGITSWVPNIGIPGATQREAHVIYAKDVKSKRRLAVAKSQKPSYPDMSRKI